MGNIKRNKEYLTQILVDRNLSEFLSIKQIYEGSHTVILIDVEYGEYATDIKMFCPQSNIPLHSKRRNKNKIEAYKIKYIGSEIGVFKILDVFYGPDRGYKNRSYYLEYLGKCGHVSIATKVHLLKHKKTLNCLQCSTTNHGVRARINGIRPKRTPTYNYWVSVNKTLPEKYRDFSKFYEVAGDKPCDRATIIIDGDKLLWARPDTSSYPDLNRIASAIRQVFRHSSIYKEAIAKARVETEDGPRYRCQICNELSMRKDIQVDHLDAVAPIDGSPLNRETLIDRIWNDRVQVVDKKCHSKKSTIENKIRKANKMARKKKLTTPPSSDTV